MQLVFKKKVKKLKKTKEKDSKKKNRKTYESKIFFKRNKTHQILNNKNPKTKQRQKKTKKN